MCSSRRYTVSRETGARSDGAANTSNVPPGSTRASASFQPTVRGDHRGGDRHRSRPAPSARAPATRSARRSAATHLIPAPSEHLHPQLSDRAAADDEHASARHALRSTEHAGKRLDPDPSRWTDADRRDDVRGAKPLREPAGLDPQLLELLAGRLMPGTTAIAVAARHTVHDGDARSVVEDAFDLVSKRTAR